ncbi:MAG: MerR family transcriptional regulator [Clostridium chrysemydis]|uniref:MerR family transcriptional regulator n=1 Tax=Clostridium TaxID=1485 RepID=UPI00215299D9|nr:MerR family transcriptional regulator [Clostridium sp. LY3-2]MCR6513678.1 MerR family transcriptional regulator [Clostridium sp. LY3-2]
MGYSVKQVSDKTGLSSYTIRYYDKEGLLPFIKRNEKGNRIFNDQDLEWLSLIHCLKNTGMQLKEIKRYIDWYVEGSSTFNLRKEMLIKHREEVLKELDALKLNLKKIDDKINYYYKNENDIHPNLKL